MTHGIESTECKTGPNGYPCDFCQWATSAEQRARHHAPDIQSASFADAWANAPREYTAFTENDHAEYWFRKGWQMSGMIHTQETNENLRLMMAARKLG